MRLPSGETAKARRDRRKRLEINYGKPIKEIIA
jgi:hypothetical protein